jgi:RNA polymerase sigma-70 factor (ECF subfamily)
MGFEEINQQSTQRIYEISEKLVTSEISERERNELANLIYPKLKFFIWKFCRNDFDTEEALQWTLKKVFKNISQFRHEKGRFTTWIYTIARNETLYYLYYKKKDSCIDIDSCFNSVDRPDSDSKESIENFDLHQVYLKTVSAIHKIEDIELRTIAIDKMINHKKIKSIAEDLQLNENTVKTKLRKIRNDLKETVLKENPHFREKIKEIL